MRFSSFFLALVAAVLPVAESRADNCQFTFRCQGNICERVLPESCAGNIHAANVVVNAPPSSEHSVDSSVSGSTSTTPTFVRPEQSSVNITAAPALLPPIGLGCAENGSCYGDTSNINGTPKTNHVNGYFKSNGTYVRGYYRSSGRR
jgi:hypothetical protein